jgi:phenylacetic acid degradation operon negative regulatory protein
VLLPGDWPGHQARQLCREIYHRLLPASERHLDRHFQLANGQTPEASPTVYARFGEVDPLG